MSIGFFKNSNAWFTKTVLIILAITFVVGFGYVGGISIGGGGTGSATAVEVNGEEVPLSRYYMVRENLYRQFSQGNDNIPDAAREFINYSAMKQLIDSKLLAQKARELGFTISDRELSEAIRSNPSFQYNGQFIGKQNYEETIKRALNISVAEFENSFRDELLVGKLVDLIEETAKVTDEELLNLYRMENEQVKLSYLTFSPDDFKNPDMLKDSELREYYENNKAQFKTGEERKIKYVSISSSDFADAVEIDEAEVKAYYDSYRDEFTDESGEVKDLASVRDEITALLRERKAETLYTEFLGTVSASEHESLEELMSKNSLNAEITETGYIDISGNENPLPGFVINRVFNSPSGEITTVRGQNELWIAQVTEIREPGQKSFDEVKDEIAEIIMNDKAEKAAKIAAEETLNKIKDSRKSLNSFSGSTISGINQTDYFTRTNAPSFINNNEDMKIDVFMLSDDQRVAPRVYSSDGKYYILSLEDKKDIDMEDFRENIDEIEQRELVRLRRNILNGWIDELYSDAEIVYNQQALPELGGNPASS